MNINKIYWEQQINKYTLAFNMNLLILPKWLFYPLWTSNDMYIWWYGSFQSGYFTHKLKIINLYYVHMISYLEYYLGWK
jgi:hypothetical protein